MEDICAYLRSYGIAFERCDHPAVFTCEESERLVPDLPGVSTKNLFLRNGKGDRHFLVIVDHETRTDLKALRGLVEADKLIFASPEDLKRYLGVEPGSATILGLVFDPLHHVEVLIDRVIWDADFLQCHPLVNTASLVIPHAGVETFLKAVGHHYSVIDVPRRV